MIYVRNICNVGKRTERTAMNYLTKFHLISKINALVISSYIHAQKAW